MNDLTLPLKELEEEEKTELQISRSKKIIKIRMEINKIETKKNKKRLLKLRASSLKR